MPEIMLTAAAGVIVLTAVARKNRLRESLAIIRQYRPRHVISSVAVLAAVSGTAWGLITVSPVSEINPVLWIISKIFHAGNGHGQANLMLSGLNWKWYAIIFLLVLALALPRFAQAEEVTYRKGTRNWVDGSLKSLRFGLVHMFMLIPFGASLALTLAGLWFTHQYFKGGTERSTVYHAAFNSVIIMVLLILVLALPSGAVK